MTDQTSENPIQHRTLEHPVQHRLKLRNLRLSDYGDVEEIMEAVARITRWLGNG